jgi:transposase
MEDIDRLKEDARAGRIDSDRLVDLIVTLQRHLQAANKRIEELEKQLGGAGTAKVAEPFSLRAEEQRQQARGQKKRRRKGPQRRGRLKSVDKVKRAERTTPVYPEGVDRRDCKLSHVRPVWRLENGRAMLIAYEIHRGPNKQYGQIPGVLGRSEFGMEIILEIAHLVYVVGLSFDKVCQLLKFFQNLHLSKSQVDKLLHKLARHWEKEFEALCTLLANSLVVHADETSWSVHSVWALLSEKARVVLYGVHKDADTLKLLLDAETFAGLVVSDDAAVYANFTQAQKCWAHLLRKAIKLTLQDPDEPAYRTFTDRLLEIYRDACRVQRDGRLGDAGRAAKVAALDDEILEMCAGTWVQELPPLEEGPLNDYRLLVNELMRLMLGRQLFTFVVAKPVAQPNGETRPVSGTNNEAERTLRGAAEARKTGRTSKTANGARRQTILASVLGSLRLYLPTFTLHSVIAEVERWSAAGRSCFAALVKKLQLQLPEQPLLDRLFPAPSG